MLVLLYILVYIYIYMYIYSTNIPPIIIINRIYENQNILSLYLFSFLVGLRTYQHPRSSVDITLARGVRMHLLLQSGALIFT